MASDKKLLSEEDKKNIINSFYSIGDDADNLLNNASSSKKIAEKIYTSHDIYFLGRKVDYAVALEGCLKLKEISYIHSEAYQSGELKHGSIALISKDTPVISIITDDDIALKTLSNIKETKARGSYSIVLSSVSDEHMKEAADEFIEIRKTSSFVMPILPVIYLQLVAYYVAKLNGCDIDKPRNLAKSVTVE